MARTSIRTLTIALAAAILAAPTAFARPADMPPSVTKAGSTTGIAVTQRPLPGPPTWPVNPQPIAPAPAAQASDASSSLDSTTIGLGIAGCLLALGGVAGVALHGRRVGRARIAA